VTENITVHHGMNKRVVTLT